METDRLGHKKRIGLFGGTLDPIHLGHLRAAEEVFERAGLHEVWFLPAPLPPHKLQESLSPFEKRLEMARLATEGLPHLKASSLETLREGISYSVDLLRFIKKSPRFNWIEPFFIIGADSFLELDTWKDYKELPELSILTIITRPPFEKRDLLEKSADIFPEKDVAILEEGTKCDELIERILICPVTDLDISSTRIRNLVREGKSIRFLVTKKVQEYIMTNGLYIAKRQDLTTVKGHGPHPDTLSSIEIAKEIYNAILDNKGEEIVCLDMRGTSPLADFFIISQGRSTKHVQGMANRMKRELSRKGIKCKGIEGEEEGKWILMDFDDVVVHLFYEPVRAFYDLEGLWIEAPRMVMMGGVLVREDRDDE